MYPIIQNMRQVLDRVRSGTSGEKDAHDIEEMIRTLTEQRDEWMKRCLSQGKRAGGEAACPFMKIA